MDLKTVSDRFLYFLRKKELSQTDFETITGFSQNNLSRFIRGTVKSPKIELITALLNYFPELNLRWLLLGEGEMFHIVTTETNHILTTKNEQLQTELSKLRNELILNQEKIIQLLETR